MGQGGIKQGGAGEERDMTGLRQGKSRQVKAGQDRGVSCKDGYENVFDRDILVCLFTNI